METGSSDVWIMSASEKARGRMIDDDIKVAVMLKRSPKELGDHLVLESPQLANVEFKFPVMRELICVGEVIVQGDEGPVGGVAQVVDCHGVTVGHEEREEEEIEQEVESDGEKTLKERCACPWMG